MPLNSLRHFGLTVFFTIPLGNSVDDVFLVSLPLRRRRRVFVLRCLRHCILSSTENQMKPLTIIALISTLVMFSDAFHHSSREREKCGWRLCVRRIKCPNQCLVAMPSFFALVRVRVRLCQCNRFKKKILHYHRRSFKFDHRNCSIIMVTIPLTLNKTAIVFLLSLFASFIFRLLYYVLKFSPPHTHKATTKTCLVTQLFSVVWEANDIW